MKIDTISKTVHFSIQNQDFYAQKVSDTINVYDNDGDFLTEIQWDALECLLNRLNPRYDYRSAINEDVLDYIHENFKVEDMSVDELDNLPDKLNEDLWIEDSVTGNGSGSYTFNRAKAKEYVIDNLDLVALAAKEFEIDYQTIAQHFMQEDWEYFDVTIRCYLLPEAIAWAMDNLFGGVTTIII